MASSGSERMLPTLHWSRLQCTIAPFIWHVAQCTLCSVPVQDLAARSPCLLALSLAGTQSNDNMISTLPAACSQLQILDISWCRNITCASITNLSALSNLTALKVPPELHVQAIGKLLPAQSSLRVLHASNNKGDVTPKMNAPSIDHSKFSVYVLNHLTTNSICSWYE